MAFRAKSPIFEKPLILQTQIPQKGPKTLLRNRSIVEVVEKLDLSAVTSRYAKGGGKAYPPTLLLYGYAQALFPAAGSNEAHRLESGYIVCVEILNREAVIFS